MDKDREKTGIEDLLSYLKGYSLVASGESPDFIIKNDLTNEKKAVEVIDYYPNRTSKGKALVKIPGRDEVETRRNRLRFFDKDHLGHLRYVPKMDYEDFIINCIKKKERKLEFYRQNAPDCDCFWLLVMLDFYDEIIYEDSPPIATLFDRIFIWEWPHDISELAIDKKRIKR